MHRLPAVAGLLLALAGAMPGIAREAPPVQRPTAAQLHAAMEKLDWMIGEWEGSGWVDSATLGRRRGELVETREWQRREGTITSWVEYFKVVLRRVDEEAP